MENKLKEIINSADIKFLKFFEENLAESSQLKTVVRKKIYTLDKKMCANCTNKIDPFEDSFTLQFGQADFRKQAHFCAIDCMEYFLANLKQTKQKQKK